MLSKFPADACVKRDVHAVTVPAVGADGRHLIQHGTATIVFNLANVPCEHTFMVVEGAPMPLLGNDFLSARGAVISLNVDGQGNSRVELNSMYQGNAIRHVVRATLNSAPCASDSIRPILIVPAQRINSVAPLPGMDEVMSQWLQRCEG